VALYGAPAALSGEAAEAAARFAGVVEAASPAGLDRAGLIVDALYGAGVRLPLATEAAELVRAVNATGARVLSIDLPSGVEGAGGRTVGDAVVADRTVTFFRRKPGHLLLPGRLHCGEVTVADIGIAAGVLDDISPSVFHNRPSLWLGAMPHPAIDTHKYRRGHVVVVSGPAAATGAARLAARAAIRIGAGIVRLASPVDAVAENAAQLTAIMVRRVDTPAELGALLGERRVNAVVIGPGLGPSEAAREQVAVTMGGEWITVIDADGLSAFAGDPGRLLRLTRQVPGGVVLTPHDGEFARVFPDLATDALLSRLDRAVAAARRAGAVVVLKGADTVVADPDGRAAIADNAPPTLATAGAGDVLAGMIAGLAAQGMAAFEAAAAAVWLHGEAATTFGPGLISEDLPDVLPRCLTALGEY
jgi:hydroxyethylthiazole kinase-like uncharacterized protein yjeF